MKKLILFLLLLFLTGCGLKDSKAEILFDEEIEESVALEDEAKASFVASIDTAAKEKNEIYVSVIGCVKNPGVYIMKEGSRVYEAINAAGGVTEEGYAEGLCLVQEIYDGTQIKVPEKEEDVENSGMLSDGGTSDDTSGKVNINTATATELKSLSGIGDTKANDIISYRDTHGNFASIEDIMNVSGIKEGIFEKIKDSICVK